GRNRRARGQRGVLKFCGARSGHIRSLRASDERTELYDDRILSARNVIRLRLREVEHDPRNRRIVEKQSCANSLELTAIDLQGAQLGGGKRAGKIHDD